jgi:hypothetical protein
LYSHDRIEEVEREECIGARIHDTSVGIASEGDHISLNEDERDA